MPVGLFIARASFLFLILSAAGADAQEYWPGSSCPPWRPCGPGNSWGGNLLFRQGVGGADFRPACAAHDACFADPSMPRKACDRAMLASMKCACEGSSNPLLCRMKARQIYVGTRLFGGFLPRGGY
ncbi:MAG TPA: hypothetical protein VM165_06635 [Planctomycetaceae bacterium]|nr:hypothetical protein [Planctomycetaceae bacterium]